MTGLAAGCIGACAREVPVGVPADPLTAEGFPDASPGLLESAAEFVRIAESDRSEGRLWGRIGGSESERRAARYMADQLALRLPQVDLEPVRFEAHRPLNWRLELGDGAKLASAMPAPFDARFLLDKLPWVPIAVVTAEEDWRAARGHWVYLAAEMDGAASRTSVRSELLYEKARQADARGFVFSLPTPEGLWQSVVPVDKPFALPDERYPDGRRPIPCFSVDAADGAKIAQAARTGITLFGALEYDDTTGREGLNAVGYLPGQGRLKVAIFAHLDAFFSGANDNASGLATLIALADRLAALPVQTRPADFYFVAQSAHHDGAAGIRAFTANDPARWSAVDQAIQLEHTDAGQGLEGAAAGWPDPLNDRRSAYIGTRGWPAVREALPTLVRESAIMGVPPRILDACISDSIPVCDDRLNFCLIQGPPYYHTNHDTIDKLSREGLARGVDFHLRLLEVTGAVSPGTFRGESSS